MVFYFYSIMHACGFFFIVMGPWFVTANRALLENMPPRLSGQNLFFFKFLLSLNPYRYQIVAYRGGYQTRDQEFWNEMPPNEIIQIICRATGQCIFRPFNLLIRLQSQVLKQCTGICNLAWSISVNFWIGLHKNIDSTEITLGKKYCKIRCC